eukprot:COSAG02_NODE_24583_length_683_cov_1.359589_1_plen_40_part_10
MRMSDEGRDRFQVRLRHRLQRCMVAGCYYTEYRRGDLLDL